jgi:GT2 family glycosyltransferase
MTKVVVLMASHNRRELTVRALSQLKNQVPSGVELEAVLVDCGSTDGTAQECASLGSWVTLVEAPSTFFWAQAMARAEEVAQELAPDLLLWVNDDVDFDSDALPRLLATYSDVSKEEDAVIVGSMRSKSGEVSYGGIKFGRRISKYARVQPSSVYATADAANGNFLLCSSRLAKRLGGIDGSYGHSFADFDWTIRARRAGSKVIVAPGFYGECSRNPISGTYRDPALSAHDQWRLLLSPKGLPPAANARYLMRHGGKLWPFIWIKPYARVILRLLVGK